MRASINANGTEITVISMGDDNDYISLTDIARYKDSDESKDVVKNWMRNRSTIEFLGLWEQLNNPDFIGVEIDSFKHGVDLLNKMAIEQLNSLVGSPGIKKLQQTGEHNEQD